jgi:hypothetical protein
VVKNWGQKLRDDLRALMKWHPAAITCVDARMLNVQGTHYARPLQEKDKIKAWFDPRKTYSFTTEKEK